jgi:hypothetical protein
MIGYRKARPAHIQACVSQQGLDKPDTSSPCEQLGRQRVHRRGHLVEVDAITAGSGVTRERTLLLEEIEAHHIGLGVRIAGAEAH